MKLRTGAATILLILAAALTALSSCSTTPETVSEEPIVLSIADLTIHLVPVGREELRQRHGANTDQKRNPFIDHGAKFTVRRIVVFEATISTTESEINFAVNDNTLQIGDKIGAGTSRERLKNFWAGHVSQEEMATLHDKMLRYMLDREFTVTPDNPAEGYLVYAHNYPKEGGEGLLKFTMSTPNGDRGSLEAPIDFREYGKEAQNEETESTGIFSGEGSEGGSTAEEEPEKKSIFDQ